MESFQPGHWIYAKVLTDFLALHVLFGSGHFAQPQANIHSFWRATPFSLSVLMTFFFVAVWLSIDGVIIPILSYLPVIAPFWFIPSEDASHRFLIRQEMRIPSRC